MESLLTEPIKPAARRFSVDEYYRMAEAGILRPEERVELLDGQILCMAPIGDNHQELVDALSEILGDQRNNRYQVRAGGPIRIEHSLWPGRPPGFSQSQSAGMALRLRLDHFARSHGTVIAILIPPLTKPRPDPDLARGVWAEGAALPPAASSDCGNGAGRLCSAPGLV